MKKMYVMYTENRKSHNSQNYDIQIVGKHE